MDVTTTSTGDMKVYRQVLDNGAKVPLLDGHYRLESMIQQPCVQGNVEQIQQHKHVCIIITENWLVISAVEENSAWQACKQRNPDCARGLH